MNDFHANRDVRINHSTVNLNNLSDQPYKLINQMYPEELRHAQKYHTNLLRKDQWQRMKPLLILTAIGLTVLCGTHTFEEQLAVFLDELHLAVATLGAAATTLFGFMGLAGKSAFEERQELILNEIAMRLRELQG